MDSDISYLNAKLVQYHYRENIVKIYNSYNELVNEPANKIYKDNFDILNNYFERYNRQLILYKLYNTYFNKYVSDKVILTDIKKLTLDKINLSDIVDKIDGEFFITSNICSFDDLETARYKLEHNNIVIQYYNNLFNKINI